MHSDSDFDLTDDQDNTNLSDAIGDLEKCELVEEDP
jgi:hypothetical protein